MGLLTSIEKERFSNIALQARISFKSSTPKRIKTFHSLCETSNEPTVNKISFTRIRLSIPQAFIYDALNLDAIDNDRAMSSHIREWKDRQK